MVEIMGVNNRKRGKGEVSSLLFLEDRYKYPPIEERAIVFDRFNFSFLESGGDKGEELLIIGEGGEEEGFKIGVEERGKVRCKGVSHIPEGRDREFSSGEERGFSELGDRVRGVISDDPSFTGGEEDERSSF